MYESETTNGLRWVLQNLELLINKQANPLRPLKAPNTASRASGGALHEFSDQTLACVSLLVCLLATLITKSHLGSDINPKPHETSALL